MNGMPNSNKNSNQIKKVTMHAKSRKLYAGQKSSHVILQTFLLVIKDLNEEAQLLGKEISIWLKKRDKNIFILNAKADEEEFRELASQSDIILVLGGDGTMLGTARKSYGMQIPLLGVNFGRVGFLTDISPQNWQDSLEFLLNNGYEIQLYIALKWELIRNNSIIKHGLAVNDVVVARGCIAQSIHVRLSLDGVFLSELHSDGLICSSPLGATAYAVAAHGPVVFPALDAHTITPISPFAGSFPPLVLPKESSVEIQVNKGGDAAITVDGQNYFPLEENDIIHVRTAKNRIPMFVQHPHWFWQRLTERGFIMPGPGKYNSKP